MLTSLLAVILCAVSASSFAPRPSFTARASAACLNVAAASSSSSTIGVTAENLQLLSERGREAVLALMEYDSKLAQTHVYGNWPEAGVEDEGKKQLTEQVS